MRLAGVGDQRRPTLPIVSRVDNAPPRSWLWLCGAIAAALIPFLSGFSSTNIFYIRDLSLYFWSRHLWLRRELLSGEWPLWDPYIGGGQAAVADAMHQMFLLPVLAVRLMGSEVLGFNLWVLLPFPFAVLGMWLFLRRRSSAAASALGALAFTLSGPIVSTGNFPNMSWAVGAMPWVLWAADRLAHTRSLRGVAILGLTVAFQAFAGEPVTLSVTTYLAIALGLLPQHESRDQGSDVRELGGSGVRPLRSARAWEQLRRMGWVVSGLALGGVLAAVQLLPMVQAAAVAERSATIATGVWSMHPLALVETLAPHLFGDYFAIPSLAAAPWMPLVNTGRDPFFYSLYYGVPLFALALFGLVALGRNPWGIFWAATAGVSLVLAFGVYTPVFPFLRDHLPVISSFRFPVKYLVAFSMAVAAGAAAGWDSLRQGSGQALTRAVTDAHARQALRRARLDAVVVALTIGVIAALLAATAVFLPDATASRAAAMAGALEGSESAAAAGRFMVQALPRLGMTVAPVAYLVALLIFLAASTRPEARVASYGLYAVIATDLVVRSLGLNPVFDVRYVAEPQWLALTKADSQARFYIGGKKEGTLDALDPDSSRAFYSAPGLTGSASRAALNGQSAFYPSGWHGREMLSSDLTLLWPKLFDVASRRFFESERQARDLFLERTAVRYRVVAERVAPGRTPLVKVPYYLESYLYDWGPEALRRASVVPTARVVADPLQQIEALFKPGWDARSTVLVDRETEAAGDVAAVSPDAPTNASVEVDRSNQVRVRATVPSSGGYLLLLDSYADDWRATVDGRPATLLRANGLFRAVRLNAGSHVVDFSYRPRAFLWGAAVSGVGLLGLLVLCVARPVRVAP
jgi:hypothetical protein